MMQQTINKKNNFDLLRLLFSTTVFLVHANELSKHPKLAFITSFLSSTVAVNSFFVISGFLVTMSYLNASSTADYSIKRVRRIYPAYAVVILLSLTAGFFLTVLPVKTYLSFDLIKYLAANLSFLNLLQPSLPGVFTANSLPAVNGALWTIRFEVLFYAFIPLIVILSRKNKKLACVITLSSVLCFSIFLKSLAETIDSAPLALLLELSPELFLYFICGSFLYIFYSHYQKVAYGLFAVSMAGYVITKITGTVYPMPFFISFIVIFFACRFKYLGNWGRYGDFSYGIYIWHFPVLQTVISFKLFDKSPYIALAFSAIIIFMLSWFSWHFIEKRFLKRNSHYVVSTTQN